MNRSPFPARIALTAVALGASLQLAACATPYQPMGLRGGVKSVQITSDVAQVTARGSSLTDPDAVQRYALRKAAETTIAAGYDCFEVVSTADRSRTTQGVAAYSAPGLHGFPTMGVSMPFVRPGETFLIRMSRGRPAPDAGMVFDARDVLDHLAHDKHKA
jgi:hypothetical protein